jgi:hypothetical protein
MRIASEIAFPSAGRLESESRTRRKRGACVGQTFAAGIASPARELERHDHALAGRDAGLGACIDDDPDRFVAIGERAGKRGMTLRDIEVEIAARDGQRLYDRVGVGGQARDRDFIQFEPARSDIGELSHDDLAFRSARSLTRSI